jgi:hypothetical protein
MPVQNPVLKKRPYCPICGAVGDNHKSDGMIMTETSNIRRATQRPKHLDLPYPIAANPPVPMPRAAKVADGKSADARTRYGDWEREGIAWDF